MPSSAPAFSTVALGEPVYLDAMVNASIAPSNIVGVTWSLTTNNSRWVRRPCCSTSPLGTNVPLFKTADRVYGWSQRDSRAVPQLAGRTFFRPDVVGQYTVLGHDHHDRHHQWDDHRPDRDEHQHYHHGGHLSWRADSAPPVIAVASPNAPNIYPT